MSENTLFFYDSVSSVTDAFAGAKKPAAARLEPATCKEAEPFALRVLDDSMQPEFRQGCIILIDPTGRATHGSFVLARDGDSGFLFRQLQRSEQGWSLIALSEKYPVESTAADLGEIIGVIVQRAGVRRSYHKHYS